MTIVSITGHRPERIPDPELVKAKLRQAYQLLDAELVIQGMAAGVDLWSAKEAFLSKIPYDCAVPWAGHTARVADRIDYEKAKAHARQVHIVNPSQNLEGPWVYQQRNIFMVDRAEIVIAVWDGVKKGGTWNCVEYALKQGKQVYQINPVDGSSGFIETL